MAEGKIVLKSGRTVKIKMPPLTQNFMEHIFKETIEAALENPKEYKKLTRGESAELGISGLPSTPGSASHLAPQSPSRPQAVTVNITGPVMSIEGNADKATVDLAAKQVLDQLRTTIVEPTSSGAAATQKRIRSGSMFQ